MTTQFLSMSTIVFVAGVVSAAGVDVVNVVAVVNVVGIVLSVNVVPMRQLRSNEMPTEPKFFPDKEIFFVSDEKKSFVQR